MDASVLAAIARWPNVPQVYGWLSLTARGQWRLRGEPIGNAALREFIGRNYACDERGRWYFQNGPQRVYVALELAPWICRYDGAGRLSTHTGLAVQELRAAALLDDGRFVLLTELGAAGLDDRDAAQLLAALTDAAGAPLDEPRIEGWLGGEGSAWLDAPRCGLRGGRLPVQRLRAAEAGARFGFCARPQPD